MNLDSKIYVAGNTGMVGSAIVKNLKSKGFSNLVFTPSAHYDLTNQVQTQEFFMKNRPEYVFLAAAKVGGILANNTYRAQFIYENLMIQNNVIHSAHEFAVKKLLFLGSTCIYPKEAAQPIEEESLLTGSLEYTNEPYAIAKIAGMKMCEAYASQYGSQFIAVMPTNLYGPNDNFDLEKSHVLPALIRKIHIGKCLINQDWTLLRKDLDRYPIEGIDGTCTGEQILEILAKYGVKYDTNTNQWTVEIWGTGKPMREFLWSEELADACVFIMENVNAQTDNVVIKNGGVNRNRHINIGTGQDISIKDLANLIKNTIGFKGDLFFNSSKPDGTLRKVTNVDKLHELGWHHKIDIKEGLVKMYGWYLKVMKSS